MRVMVLLSGGMDSAVCLAYAKQRGYEPRALFVDYNQRHLPAELDRAQALARHYGTGLEVAMARLAMAGPLTGTGEITDTASSVLPFRNALLLSLGVMHAAAEGCREVWIGCNATDAAGYPDCRETFLKSFGMATLWGSEEQVRTVHAPFLHLTKREIAFLGDALGVPWEQTWSCYRGGEKACETCPACEERARAFAKEPR